MGAISIRGMTHQNGRSKWISFPWPEAREALAARMLAWLPQVNIRSTTCSSTTSSTHRTSHSGKRCSDLR